MIKKVAGLSILFAVAVGMFMVLPAQRASAAIQSVPLTTVPALDDPAINGSTMSSLGVQMVSPLNVTTTQQDTGGGAPRGYTWRLTFPSVCNGADLQNIRIVTNTTAQNEAPLGGAFLGIYGGNDLAFRSGYTVNVGEDSNTWAPVLFGLPSPLIDRGLGDGNTTFPANAGYSGALDGTWDISNYVTGEPLGIYIQQWVGGTTEEQTTIQSVVLTYDDSGCTTLSNANNSNNNSVVTTEAGPRLANTGSDFSTVRIAAGIIIVITLAITWRRKAAHSI